MSTLYSFLAGWRKTVQYGSSLSTQKKQIDRCAKFWTPKWRKFGTAVSVRKSLKICLQLQLCGNPVSTEILFQSLPEWPFRARPGLWQICLCSKVARIAEHKFGNR